MSRLWTLVAGAGLVASLLAASAAHATTTSGTILLPCSTPGVTYSDLLNAQILPNGPCGWTMTVTEASTYALTTASADLDVWFFDAEGDYIDRHSGGSSNCGSFTLAMPGGTRRLVIVLTPSMCANQFNVGFTLRYPA